MASKKKDIPLTPPAANRDNKTKKEVLFGYPAGQNKDNDKFTPRRG